MRVSLVLPTIVEQTNWGNFLVSLRVQNFENLELIVVDQIPDDGLVPLLKPYADELSIAHVRRARKGAARARNTGVEYANGDIIDFPLDDCRYPPDLLNEVVQAFADRPTLDGLTGRSIDEKGRNINGRFRVKPDRVKKPNVWTSTIEYAVFRSGRARRNCGSMRIWAPVRARRAARRRHRPCAAAVE